MSAIACLYLFIYCRCNQGIPSFIYPKRVPGPTALRIFIKILSTATLWVVIHPFIRQPVTLWVVIYLFKCLLMVVAYSFIYSFRLWSPQTAYLFIPDVLSGSHLSHPFQFFYFPGSKQGVHLIIYFLVAFLALIFSSFSCFISLVQEKCSFIYFIPDGI